MNTQFRETSQKRTGTSRNISRLCQTQTEIPDPQGNVA